MIFRFVVIDNCRTQESKILDVVGCRKCLFCISMEIRLRPEAVIITQLPVFWHNNRGWIGTEITMVVWFSQSNDVTVLL
jgi:hypothetical protein